MRKSEYPKTAKTLGQKIRKKRMDSALSLLDIAKKAHITEGYLSRIEADKQMPLPKLAAKLAEVLNDDVTEYVKLAMAKFLPEGTSHHKFYPSPKPFIDTRRHYKKSK